MSAIATGPAVDLRAARRRRMAKVIAWIVAIGVFWALLELLGIDVSGWISNLWDQIKAIPKGYLIAALVFQTGQTFFAGVSYYGILAAAYPGEVELWPIVAAYAVGVAMNGFLPANIGTFVTLFMFVMIIPGCTIGGAIAAYLVQKIFFTLAGAFVYLYMFLSVPGAFNISFGNETSHPWLTLFVVLGGAFVIVLLGRLFWRQVKKLWAQAKEGGAILATPGRYLRRAFLPSFLSWLCKLAVIGIFLAAFAIPVTTSFESQARNEGRNTPSRYFFGCERMTPPCFAWAQSFFTWRQKTRARTTSRTAMPTTIRIAATGCADSFPKLRSNAPGTLRNM